MKPETRYARSGDVNIAYQVLGEGPRDLVLVPGWVTVAVHIGARIASLAKANEVLVSSTVRDLVAGSGLMFEDRGAHPLKGVPGEWHLFGVERV